MADLTGADNNGIFYFVNVHNRSFTSLEVKFYSKPWWSTIRLPNHETPLSVW